MRLVRRTIAILLLAAAYFLAGKLGLSLAFLHPSASPIWPPSGIALAVLLLYGWRLWPGVLLGAFLVNLPISGSAVTALVIGAGNTLEALLGAHLVSRFARGRLAFQKPQDVFKFAALAGLGSSLVSPTIGVTALAWAGKLAWGASGLVWVTWWLGDAMGVLLIAPPIVLWGKKRRLRFRRARVVETSLYAMSLLFCALFIWGSPPFGSPTFPLGFLCLPVLLWPAFRFGRRESATAILLLSTIAVWRTSLGYGPFVMTDLNSSFLTLQLFMGTIAVTVMSLAAVVMERQRATAELRRSHDELEDRIAHRTVALSTAIELLQGEIEQRELAERGLRQSRLDLEMAQALAHFGSWVWDMPANRVIWSQELYRIHGLDPETPITYESFLELVHPEDRAMVDQAVRASAASGRSFEFEHRVVRPDGSLRWLHAIGQVILGPNGPVRMGGTAHDITEGKLAETERKRLEQEILEVSSREQQRLGHDLHDDLGQLLTGIALMTKTLEKKLLSQSLPEAETLAEIRRLVNQAIAKTRNLARVLSPVGLEEGGVVPALEELSVSAERVFNVSCSLVGSDSVTVRSDMAGVHIYRIAQEAISNAVRHGKADRILIALEAAGDVLRLEVRDNGKGLPDAREARTGFGLRTMRYRAGLMGGSFDIRSDDGGTTVTCTIPGIVLTGAPAADPESPASEPAAARAPVSVLGAARAGGTAGRG